MKIPRTLEINGDRWTVITRSLTRQKLEGRCHYTRREIQIDSEVPENERAEVFMHELIHACLPEHWAHEERMVRRLSPRLLNALRNIGWVP